MSPDQCWVLTSEGVWHMLAQRCRDPRSLFGRPTLCGLITQDDVLMFTQAEPTWRNVNLCRGCLKSIDAKRPRLSRRRQLMSRLAREQANVEQTRHELADLSQQVP